MRRWCDVTVGSSAPMSSIRNLFSHSQHEIASAGKQIVMVGRPELLSQSLPSFRCRLSVVYQKSLNVPEQNCQVYWSKGLNSNDSKTHACYLWYIRLFKSDPTWLHPEGLNFESKKRKVPVLHFNMERTARRNLHTEIFAYFLRVQALCLVAWGSF